MRQPASSHARSGLLQSIRIAIAGIGVLIVSERNARIHAFITVIVVLFGVVCALSRLEWCLIVVALAMVWAAEAFNTALEYLTNLVSPDVHPLAGKAKDVAAAAVLLSACGAALIGVLIFGPHMLKMLQAIG